MRTAVWMLGAITLTSLCRPLIDSAVPLQKSVIYFNSDITSVIVIAKSSFI